MRSAAAARRCLLIAVVAVGAAPAVRADPMGQGEAAINVRSDVKMALRGTQGTSRARLEQLSRVVTARMSEVRACYRELVAKRPATVGAFQITVGLPEGERNRFAIEESGGSDDELKRCVLRVLTRAHYAEVQRPAAAVVTLEFSNTRAAGQVESIRRTAEQDRIDVQVDEQGLASAEWKNGDGKVRFRASARGPHAEAIVTTAIQGLRDGYATFLDCRRRCDKDGLSPAGDIDVQLRLPRRGGKAKMKLKACTVPHKRAARCNERAFRRTRFGSAPPGARADVRITFGP